MTTVAATSHVAHAHHDDRSFVRKYIFSTDHKIIGIQFLFVSLFFLLVGGVLAMQIRWQLGFPGQPMPGGAILPETMAPGGVILPEYYIQLVTMHGTFMVFFAIMPLLVGVFANFLIPLKIGAHDMAFPRINMASFWAAFLAGLVMFASFFVPDGAARAGWTMYAPLSARPDLSGAGYGQIFWCISIVLLGLSSILGSLNYITTIINNRSRKPVFGYHAMVFAIVGIGFLGWLVWGHHMFMSGMNPTLGSTFMVTTMVIAVPSAIKVFNWLGTMWRGNLHFHVPMLNAVAFVAMFVIGGLSGIYMAATPVGRFIHDTYFIVAHLHYVLFGGSLFALFGALTYWYPKMFGKLMSEPWGKVHFWLTFVFYNLVFFPMHTLGMAGHMRRIYDPTQYDFLKPYQPLNEFISISAFALFAVQAIFALNFILSLKWGKKAPQNPWEDNGLEWSLPAPAPHGNWETVPTVYRGPYEFSSPQVPEDYLPQYRKLPTDREPARTPVAGH